MTFDAWIAKILGALKEEDGAVPRPVRRNQNPVELRQVGGAPKRPRKDREAAVAHAPFDVRDIGPGFAPPPVLPMQPPIAEHVPPLAAIAGAPPTQQPATMAPAPKVRRAPTRATLLETTSSGAVRFARTTDAELARRKAERSRIEAERIAAELARIAAAQAEAANRKPSWVRFSRTPDSLLKVRNTSETNAAGEQPQAETPADDIVQDAASAAPEAVEQDMAVGFAGSEIAAIADLVADLHTDVRAPRPLLVEILIPRSPAMARTDIFLGDAAGRVHIEEHDLPDLRRAPAARRAHPQEEPLVRSEIQRLADMLRSVVDTATAPDESERVAALRVVDTKPAPAPAEKARVRVKANSQQAPVIASQRVAPEARPMTGSAKQSIHPTLGDGLLRRSAPRNDGKSVSRARNAKATAFDMPTLDLLHEHEESSFVDTSPEHLEDTARLLEGVLDDFGVKGEIGKVHPGPVVTLYELEPAPGVKSSRVIGLADDIARSMSAISARVAVVQGRNAIGIELPNHDRETVFLRELLASADFEGSKHRLAIALGKTIGGEPVIVDLARMPHLLVAGTTGSGKSVAINTMILSLLYRLKPEQCRLIMVDPKMLELSVYDGIPHLLTPVVTDPKKAVVALKWAVREMEDRYKKMSKLGVRNIDGFNARVAEAAQKGEAISRTVQTGFDRETGEAIYEQEAMELAPLPYIVVVVDEMADLMMVAGKDIEGAIQRLAQMARAAGIHLIMATQRPSVDVITGTIKANFPTRISFQVTSKIDSRTILGEQGAEQLLGQGDMLYMAGGGRISRVHGPFVSDAEVEKVVAHLKQQGAPEYLDAITIDEDEENDGDGASGGDYASDESADLYDRAVNIVLRDRKCSVSYIQRRLSVGYNKAASLVERMEKEGVVGQANHSGKREILVGNGVDRGAFDD
jgi:DNA segregation ATPase FtsK/SpoIIIE, S-DNA-T family